MQENKLALFKKNEVRMRWFKNDWYYAIEDVIFVLTNLDSNYYIEKLKTQDKELGENWDKICIKLEMIAKDGNIRKIRVADTKGILRIIQSIPFPRAEEYKMWLVNLGDERLIEISKNNSILLKKKTEEIIELLKDINQ